MKTVTRAFILGLVLLLGPAPASPAPPLRIGLTAVILDDRTGLLEQWRDYLARRLGRPVAFVQRTAYREVVELLVTGRAEAAWLCGFPYVRFRERLRLVAVPLYRGEPLYQSYLIVPASDTDTRSILDLNGRVFAYSDPDSNSGFLVPQYRLRTLGRDPARFFRRTFFTWAHRKVVEAVAVGLADGGAVDGYIWESLARTEPQLTARTRVVERSRKFGFPPIVARADADEATVAALRRVLVGMARDPEGRQILARLNLDGFTPGDDTLFADIRAMMLAVAP
ncbi:PhnD/SsuA/transferrin family substrate-binding protein [Inmirania thermothiophila]|uniref:Phosphonate transport system substrate-binding protein n=1 Tax=Inmirania thermothiophila TaxID=1750597 RepID=A0A3N1XZG7_9GAMM|nr:PhnD/SsuA/transferrin family substrate-binding protein [Inmirania thermothiophila]ROR31980.1 phosphonate transport system substrate-binding protein [Inmirania thermothiophila]